MLRARCILLFAIAVWSTPSIACELFAGEARYRIDHEIFGTIGEEKLTVRCDDDRMVVDRMVDVDVRFAMISLHRRQAHYTEVWQGQRLIRFQGRTDDNGERTTLAAEADTDEAIEIQGAGVSIRVPRMAMPTDPWHMKLIHRTLLFDRINGQAHEVRVTDLGVDRLTIEGQEVDARKFAVSGMRDQELWFDDASGLWLRSTIRHASGDIMITRYNLSSLSRVAKVDADAPGS
jgi:hypothetical protein